MKRIKGFTLVELAVTVMIIIILMSVSVPIYQANMTRYKQAEGYALLASIRSAQEQYYSQYGNFLAGSCGSGGNGVLNNYDVATCNEEVLGINARTNKYYTKFYINGHYRGVAFYPDKENIKYCFGSRIEGINGALQMTYNLTSGVTIK